MIKQAQFVNSKGMNQDLSISKFSPDLIYAGLNIRINSGDNNTLFTITNERGNKRLRVVDPDGIDIVLNIIVGYCIINDYLILFTTTRGKSDKTITPIARLETDIIYRLEKHPSFDGVTNFSVVATTLYRGQYGGPTHPTPALRTDNSLNFGANSLIETLGLYESVDVQKVYFVEKNNPIRFINIAPTADGTHTKNRMLIDPSMRLMEEFRITKRNDSGKFHSGVIQYAVSYWNKNGAETNIALASNLYYISDLRRAGSPEEIHSNSFKVEILNTETSFDFQRVYAIHRTSLDAVPTVRIIADIDLADRTGVYTITNIVDDGIIGRTFPPEALNFIGGEELYAGTITQKDNTLFVGNIYSGMPSLLEEQEALNDLRKSPEFASVFNTTTASRDIFIRDYSYRWETPKFYLYNPYTLSLNSDEIKHWKYGETYRFGIQAQYKDGRWSNPLFVGDWEIDETFKVEQRTTPNPPVEDVVSTLLGNTITYTQVTIQIPPSIINSLGSKGFVKVRPVYVPLTESKRSVVSQGIVNSTLFTLRNRGANKPFAKVDYYTRPNQDLTRERDIDIFTEGGYAGHLLVPTISTHLSSVEYPSFRTSVTKDKTDTSYIPGLIPNSLQAQLFDPAGFPLYNNHPAGVFDISYLTNGNTQGSDVPYAEIYTTRDTIRSLFRREIVRWVSPTPPFPPHRYGMMPVTLVNTSTIDEYMLDAWLIDKNVLSFWSPEVYYDAIPIDLDTIGRIRYRGLACITNTSLKWSRDEYQFDDTTIPKHDTNISFDSENFFGDVTINHIIPAAAAGTRDAYLYLWDKKPKQTSRFMTSSWNIMLTKKLDCNIYTPSYKRTSDDAFSTYRGNPEDASGSMIYAREVDEIIAENDGGVQTTRIAYKANNHLVFALKNMHTPSDTTLKHRSGLDCILPEFWQDDLGQTAINGNEYVWNANFRNNTDVDMTTVFLRSYDWTGKDILTWVRLGTYFDAKNVRRQTGPPYLWIVDLIRDIQNQYGSDTYEDLVNLNWVPCGARLNTGTSNVNPTILTASEGDTFIQRFDYMKVAPIEPPLTASQSGVTSTTGTAGDSESVTTTTTGQGVRYTEVVSVWLESFINLDGRWDSHRYDADVRSRTFENYTQNNIVYSQQNNFFNWNIINEKLLVNDDMSNTLVWSQPKLLGETIDTWTNLWLINSYTSLGTLGPLNFLDNFKNEIYGFQDSGIFQVLYNSRVQVPTSDGTPIQITQGIKVPEISYLTKKRGATNKWAIQQSVDSLYFMDTLNKDLCVLGTNESISDSLGFRTWMKDNTVNTGEFNVVVDSAEFGKSNRDSFILSVDTVKDDLYISNVKDTLLLSERLKQFESFFSYQDTSFMFNIWGEFIMIKPTYAGRNWSSLWATHKGDYNSFFDGYPNIDNSSQIEYFVNPEPHADKVFNNIQYRADVLDGNNVLLPNQTFNTLEVTNEYQSNSRDLFSTAPVTMWKHKKFRIWNFPFPRQANSLNRIRNPWVRTKLTFDNPNHYKLQMHDFVVSYTV